MKMWDGVTKELDVWQREGRVAVFWWRDDDAVDVTPQLRRLACVASDHLVPLGLAVIPSQAKPRLATFVHDRSDIDVLVHGYAHLNHEREGRAKQEFGRSRPLNDAESELRRGLEMLRRMFGERCIPVLVPPWNRIAPHIAARGHAVGYRGLSTWKPLQSVIVPPGLVQVNTHLDLIDWRRGRRVKEESLIAGLLLRKLRWRRKGGSNPTEPLGLLTHHLLWSDEKESAIRTLLQTTRSHPAVRWRSPRRVFGLR